MRIKLFLIYNNMSAKEKTADIMDFISKSTEGRDEKFYDDLLKLADKEIKQWQNFKTLVTNKKYEYKEKKQKSK